MTDTTIEQTPKEKLAAAIAKLGLSITSEFVPFSQSRNKAEKSPSLNWKVTLHNYAGKQKILTTDYMAGCGHCPSDKHKDRIERSHMIAFECERGFKAQGVRFGSRAEAYGATVDKNRILPDAVDVIWSLSRDADVLDAGGFEEWASEYGYDTDSRSAEKTYRACLEIALKLRNAIGDAGLQALREAGQDY